MADISTQLRDALTKMQSSLRVSEPETPELEPDYRAEEIERAWKRSGVPTRYLGVPAATRPAGWTYITGPVGSGKTYGACAILRRFIEDKTWRMAGPYYRAPRVRFTTASGYLSAIKAAFDDPDDTKAQILAQAEMLVLDDLGQEAPTAWACEQLFNLINDRYNDDLPLVVTSQFTLAEIAGRLSANGGREQAEAIASRLMGECTAYKLAHVDRRAQWPKK